MTVIGEAFIAIRPDGKGFEGELGKTVVPAGTKVAKTLATAIGGAFVLSKIKGFAQAGIAELQDAEAAHAQTAAAIKSTGGAANVSAEHIEQLAASQLKLTGTDDELIQKGANLLLTFTGVRNEVGKSNDIFDQAVVAAQDLSRAGFGSVESASVLLGKALNDPVQGLTALQRVGVRLTDDQKNLVRELVATGDTLGAQKVILEEVNRQVGGSAEAYGKTLPGQLAIAQEALSNTKGELVAGMAPALQLTAGLTTALTDQFARQPQVLQQIEGGLILVVGGLASVVTPLKAGVDLWRSFSGNAKAAADAQQALAGGSAALTTGSAAAATATGQLAGSAGAASFAVDAAAEATGGLAAEALNSSSSVETLYTKTGKLPGRFASVKSAAFGLGVQLGVLYGATQLLGDSADHLDLNELQKDLLDLADNSGAAEFTGEIDKLRDAVEQIAAPSVGTQINNFSNAWSRALGDTNDDLSNARARVDDFDKALAALAQQDPEAASASLAAIGEQMDAVDFERLKGLLDDYDGAVAATEVQSRLAARGVDELSGSAEDAVDPTSDLAGATSELGGVTEDTAEEVETYADKLEAARTALDELFGTTNDAIESEFAYRDAQDATADALAELTQLRKDGKGGTDEYRRSQDDAAQALFRQSQAAADNAEQQYSLSGATLDAADKANVQRAELERLRDTLNPNSPLRARLQGMIDKLREVPESKRVTIDVLTGQALVDLDRLARRINDFSGGEIRISVGGGGGVTLAGGGVVPRYLAAGGIGGPRGTDTVPAWLTPGEGVVNTGGMSLLGAQGLAALNRGQAPAVESPFTVGQLVVQGATVEGAYATGIETVRQLRAEHFRQTGVVG